MASALQFPYQREIAIGIKGGTIIYNHYCLFNYSISTYAILIPLEEFLDAILNLTFVGPTQRMQFGYVYEFAHGAIRFIDVKFHCAIEAYGLHYQF